MLPAVSDVADLKNTWLQTDQGAEYRTVGKHVADHATVNHNAGGYVGPGGVGTNLAEGYFSQLKRSLDGTHHHVSRTHLHRYLANFDFLYSSARPATRFGCGRCSSRRGAGGSPNQAADQRLSGGAMSRYRLARCSVIATTAQLIVDGGGLEPPGVELPRPARAPCRRPLRGPGGPALRDAGPPGYSPRRPHHGGTVTVIAKLRLPKRINTANTVLVGATGPTSLPV